MDLYILLLILFITFTTGIGGLLVILIGKNLSNKTVAYLLSIASGFMVGIVLIELIPEAIQYTNIFINAIGIVTGALLIFILNYIIDNIDRKKKQTPFFHETPDALMHQSKLIDDDKSQKKLFRAGIIMLIAIALHNLPEGLAIGATLSLNNISMFLTLAIIIAAHNIPEGMAIAAPLLAGGMSKLKVLFWTTIAGLPMVLAGILGYFIGGLNDGVAGFSLAFASGAMLYVVFGEIIPQTTVMTKSKVPALITLGGILIATFIVFLLH